MMRILGIILLMGSVCFTGQTKRRENDQEPHYKGSIQVVPVNSTPQAENIELRISYPEENQIYPIGAIGVRLFLRGFALGADSDFPRAKELLNSKFGQTLHVVVDNEPYFPYNGPSVDPFDEEGDFYQANYRFKLPFTLKKGMHTLRIFPCRTYGESLKCAQCFRAVAFYIGDETRDYSINLRLPFLTYNEPSNYFVYQESMPILLDFFISNAVLSKNGYKVKLLINDKEITKLTEWKPYYLYGLGSGKHVVQLILLDGNDRAVSGSFNDVKRTIQVK